MSKLPDKVLLRYDEDTSYYYQTEVIDPDGNPFFNDPWMRERSIYGSEQQEIYRELERRYAAFPTAAMLIAALYEIVMKGKADKDTVLAAAEEFLRSEGVNL